MSLEQFDVDYTKEILPPGVFGIVYTAARWKGAKVAAKMIRFQSFGKKAAEDIFETLSRVAGHINVLNILGKSEDDACLWIVMDFCVFGNLSNVFTSRPVDLAEISLLMLQTASGLEHIHSLGIVHGSVKPENILVTRDDGTGQAVVKISDFSVFTVVDLEEVIATRAETPERSYSLFFPPERYCGSEPATPGDIFAFGLVWLSCLQFSAGCVVLSPKVETGETFSSVGPIGLMMYSEKRGAQKEVRIVNVEGASAGAALNARKTIEKMVLFDPAQRLPVEAVRSELQKLQC